LDHNTSLVSEWTFTTVLNTRMPHYRHIQTSESYCFLPLVNTESLMQSAHSEELRKNAVAFE